MSESKYSPEVNIPQNNPDSPASLQVLFLKLGQYMLVSGSDLMLYQAEPGQIGLGIQVEDKRCAFVLFPGTLTTAPPKEAPDGTNS